MPHMDTHVPKNNVSMLNENGGGVSSVHDCRRDPRLSDVRGMLDLRFAIFDRKAGLGEVG